MRAFGKYISRFLVLFVAVLLILLLINAVSFFWIFRQVVFTDYGETAPRRMLEKVAAVSSAEGIPAAMEEELRRNQIWAMFLSPDGRCLWQVDLPEELPTHYTVQDVAVFSKGYLHDDPVFVWAEDDGLLVLGYPQNSYIKLTGNYYAADLLKLLPLFVGLTGLFDLTVIFLIYFWSKRKILKGTGPLVASVEALSHGTPVHLSVKGELSGVAESVNRVSHILIRQNQARANWISGVSHDIRTPLSVIMGYANRIAQREDIGADIREQADAVYKQSIKIKELVQDLNLVSRLEYEMQPLHKEAVRLSKLLRTYLTDLLNTGIPAGYAMDIDIAPDAENAMLECDARLIERAVNNLVQNSIQHNPQGCGICLSLALAGERLILTVRDDGNGLSRETLRSLEETPHYMESPDARLDLRHGLGLRIVRKIAAAHHGTFRLANLQPHGCEATLVFPCGGMQRPGEA